MRRVFGAVVLAGVMAACGGGSKPSGSSTASSTTTTTTATTTTTTSTTSTISTTSTTATTTPSTATTSSSSSDVLTVQVFFLDQDAYTVGRQPFTRPVDRTVARSTPARGALEALFAGPTSEESAGGLRFVASGATGFADLRIADGTAHVRLVGGCSSGGSTFSVAEEIATTLRQFSSVHYVKIYDPSGATEQPDGPGDSIPVCLEP